MASGLHFVVLLVLACGLWIGADAAKPDECCQTCRPGWTQFGESCYLFVSAEKTWLDAGLHCKKLKANLASLHGNLHYSLRAYVHRVTKKHTSTWLGGYSPLGGNWLWSDGTPFYFKAWGKNEPNGNKGKVACMEMNFSGRDYINDTLCDLKKPYFCGQKLVKPCHCCT